MSHKIKKNTKDIDKYRKYCINISICTMPHRYKEEVVILVALYALT